jgi:outer membrane protein assembly factor BamB
MRKHKWLPVILISIVLILPHYTSTYTSASASSGTEDWIMFRHNPSHSGYTTGNSPTNSAKLLWTYKTNGLILSSPAVANGCVILGSKDGNVYCLNCSNGKLIWNYTEGNEVNSSPAVYNSYVYIGTNDGSVHCIDAATGIPFWKSQVGGIVRSSPAVVDGRVYIGSGDHNMFCLNATNGNEIWSYPTSHRIQSSPAVSDGILYFASDDYHVYALNASTGNEIWRIHTGSVFSSPSVYNDCIYIGSIDGYVCALNGSTGSQIWRYKTADEVNSSPAIAYGCVYVGCNDNNVYCLNASSGEKIWESPTDYWVRSSPAVANGNVYVGSEDYSIYCFDAFTGAKKWSYTTENFIESSPTVVGSTLYFGSDDFHIYAFTLCNSTVENLPPQSANTLTWTTVVFDSIACIIGAGIIFAVIYAVLQNNRHKKRKAETKNIPVKKRSWFSAHLDALCILAILVFSAIYFFNLGDGPLWVADEQIYSQWAFHMVRSGDYLTPWAFGEITFWIAKPPLYMWLMSLSYQVLGVNNFASRFWSSIFGSFSLIAVFYLGKTVYNRKIGFLAAVVLGTFTTFYVFARHAMTDVLFTFSIIASIYFLILSEKSENADRIAVLSGVFFGLALMTKQIQALLIPLIIFTYLVATTRSFKLLSTKTFKIFFGVAIAIFSPWLIYMILRFGPTFWESYLLYSGVTRTFSPIEGNIGGYLFYFNYFLNSENLIWIILLPFATGFCAFNAAIKRSKADTLILFWIIIVLAVFTFVQTKLYWYILPAFPAFALAISSLLYHILKKIHLRYRMYKVS